MPVTLAPVAARDVEEIGDYIHRDRPLAAFRFVRALRDRCDRIADAPQGGTLREDLWPGLRSVTFRRYVIFYTTDGPAVRIERILHGARDIPAAFAAVPASRHKSPSA